MIRADTDELIAFLNSLVDIDANAMDGLFGCRAPCNDAMLNHPTVQVNKSESINICDVSILGILNGYCGIDENNYGPITACYDNNNKLIGFKRTGFTPLFGNDKNL